MLSRWLSHPLTRDYPLDDPRTTVLRREILRRKRFLRRVYEDWYDAISAALPPLREPVLEIGSGAGFLAERLPNVVSSDVFPIPGVACRLDATALPFADASLSAVVGTNVLHHVPRPRLFFAEARRCVRAGGAIVLIEPWVSRWSRIVYTRLHHEPFAPDSPSWDLPSHGPLSDANGALPWILFSRDRERFEHDFPEWEIASVRPMMPLLYLLSGGISTRLSMPAWSYGAWRRAERALPGSDSSLALFALIVLRRRI